MYRGCRGLIFHATVEPAVPDARPVVRVAPTRYQRCRLERPGQGEAGSLEFPHSASFVAHVAIAGAVATIAAIYRRYVAFLVFVEAAPRFALWVCAGCVGTALAVVGLFGVSNAGDCVSCPWN